MRWPFTKQLCQQQANAVCTVVAMSRSSSVPCMMPQKVSEKSCWDQGWNNRLVRSHKRQHGPWSKPIGHLDWHPQGTVTVLHPQCLRRSSGSIQIGRLQCLIDLQLCNMWHVCWWYLWGENESRDYSQTDLGILPISPVMSFCSPMRRKYKRLFACLRAIHKTFGLFDRKNTEFPKRRT